MHNSNPDFESQVTDAIQRAAHLAGRKLRCETREGFVTLHGTVDSYFQKQMAQEAVRRIDGVEKITNLLQVAGVNGAGKKALAL